MFSGALNEQNRTANYKYVPAVSSTPSRTHDLQLLLSLVWTHPIRLKLLPALVAYSSGQHGGPLQHEAAELVSVCISGASVVSARTARHVRFVMPPWLQCAPQLQVRPRILLLPGPLL